MSKQERIARTLKRYISKEIKIEKGKKELREMLFGIIDKSESIYSLLSINISWTTKRNNKQISKLYQELTV